MTRLLTRFSFLLFTVVGSRGLLSMLPGGEFCRCLRE